MPMSLLSLLYIQHPLPRYSRKSCPHSHYYYGNSPPQIFPLYRDIADYRGNIPAAAFLIYTDRGKIGMVEDVMGPL